MKFEEVLLALREGKKIRRKYWESDRKYIYLYFENSNDCFKLYVHKNNSEDDETWNCLPIADLIIDDWEIFKEPKKVKLRDLTEEQYNRWLNANCEKLSENCCSDCPFNIVDCISLNDTCRFKHKDLFSDKFLDQEIEVEEE